MKDPQFGPLIRASRIAKGWTQQDLATALGYETVQFISLIENGNSKCPLKVLGQMIVLLGIPETKIVAALTEHYAQSVETQINEGKQLAAASSGQGIVCKPRR